MDESQSSSSNPGPSTSAGSSSDAPPKKRVKKEPKIKPDLDAANKDVKPEMGQDVKPEMGKFVTFFRNNLGNWPGIHMVKTVWLVAECLNFNPWSEYQTILFGI